MADSLLMSRSSPQPQPQQQKQKLNGYNSSNNNGGGASSNAMNGTQANGGGIGIGIDRNKRAKTPNGSSPLISGPILGGGMNGNNQRFGNGNGMTNGNTSYINGRPHSLSEDDEGPVVVNGSNKNYTVLPKLTPLPTSKASPTVSSSSLTNVTAPQPANSIMNRKANPGSSLYQSCLNLRSKLHRIPNFSGYLEYTTPEEGNNPVNSLMYILRLGTPLCAIYNAFGLPNQFTLSSNPLDRNLKERKHDVYHFLLVCRTHLNVKDEDLFAISELFSDNTKGYVKVTTTIKVLLDMLEERDLLLRDQSPRSTMKEEEMPKGNRAKVVNEILDTERKYVQDMEILQRYMEDIKASEVISADTGHHLFSNLNELVDFQRRFLIEVEANASLPPSQQNFGALFIDFEGDFACYEPFCTNYAKAVVLAQEECPKLMRLAHVVEPTYELPSLLIKPIQRICKYPLLLSELKKYSDKDDLHYAELDEGKAATNRILNRVNEERRKGENEDIVEDLARRVEDWKGHSINSFGSLVLQDIFFVTKSEMEREYHVYLFQKILLCCKETPGSKSKSKGGNKKSKKEMALQLKGRIFMNNVIGVVSLSKNGQHSLQVFWKGDVDQEYFILKCRNDETLKLWHSTLQKQLDEAKALRSRMEDSRAQNGQFGGVSRPSNTQLVSLQNLNLDDQRYAATGDDSDENTLHNDDDTEEESDFGQTISRNVSNTSAWSRSESTVWEPQRPGHYGNMRTTTVSSFSTMDSPMSSRSSASNTFSFFKGPDPNNRYTAPPIGRSRDNGPAKSPGGRPPLNSSASAMAQNRARSVSSPNVNNPPRPNIQIPSTFMVNSSNASSGQSSPTSNFVPRPFVSGSSFTSNGSNASAASKNTLKLKVCFFDDVFVIIVAPSVTFPELVERIERKIRLCGGDAGKSGNSLRIKYEDEDGDLVLICSEEDFQMAIEGRTQNGQQIEGMPGSLGTVSLICSWGDVRSPER